MGSIHSKCHRADQSLVRCHCELIECPAQRKMLALQHAMFLPAYNLLRDPVLSVHCRHSSEVLPDVLVVGTALWHVLHVHDAAAYERQLALLRRLKLAMLPSTPAFFLAPSEVCDSRACHCPE